jgi:hypothetical protein
VPKKVELDQNASVLTNFLSDILNSQTESDLQDVEYLLVAGFQFREEFLLLHLKRVFSLVVIHFETPEIAKMLHNVYKGSCIGKYPLRKPFTADLPC